MLLSRFVRLLSAGADISFSAAFVCLFIRTISQKPMQLESPTWRWNVPRWVLETHLFWSQRVKGQGHESQKHFRRGSLVLHSCECWLLLVWFADYSVSSITKKDTDEFCLWKTKKKSVRLWSDQEFAVLETLNCYAFALRGTFRSKKWKSR